MIAEELAGRIESGDLAEGELMPSEAQLCELHSVSRHTVREAIRMLSQLGLVDAKPGIGTRVISQKGFGYVLQIKEISDLQSYAMQTSRQVIGRTTIHGAEAGIELPGGPGKAWLQLELVRQAVDTEAVVAWTKIFVPPRYGRVVDAYNGSEPVYQQIEREFGIKTARLTQEVYAVGVPKQAANYLDLEPGAPALAVRRDYYDENDEVFEASLNIYPPDAYRNLTEFRLAAG